MFGRKRKKDEESTGLAGLSNASVTPSVTVTPATSPTPAPPPPAPPPPAPTAGAAPGAAAGTMPGAITPQMYATMAGNKTGPAMLAQILSGHGPVGELIAQIKADPQGFRDRMMAQAQAAGVSTYVMTPQGMAPLTGGGTGATPPQHVDVIDELTKAANLHDQGALTDEEFESLKKKLLGQ